MTGALQAFPRILGSTLRDRWARSAFFVGSMLFFILSILLLVVTIPGNTIWFQFSILRPQEYALLIFLAVLTGLQVSLRVYSRRACRQREMLPRSIAHGALTGVSGFSAFFASALGTAACASCLASVFGILGLGTGTLFFVLEHRAAFLIVAIVLMLGSLLFAVRKVDATRGTCEPQTTPHAG